MGIIIGAHVSAAGTLVSCLDRAREIGVGAIQIFATGPQSWRPHTHSEPAIAALRERSTREGVLLVLHAIYLINLAASDPAHLGRSRGSLKQYLQICAAIGGKGVIVHTGSHKGVGFAAVRDQIVAAIHDVLEDTPDGPMLILENSAGGGGSIGARFSELGAIIGDAGDPRLGVCIDTCHAFAAGYDLRTPDTVAAVVAEFDREVGRERLVAIHANDSKAGLGSGLDRHENIGDGQIGYEGFRAILANPAFDELPFILEVPGLSGRGPDRENVERLRRLAAEATPGSAQPTP